MRANLHKTADYRKAGKVARHTQVCNIKVSVDSELETLHTLFKVDMLYGLNWSKNGDVVSLSFPDNCKTVNRHLKKAYEARQALMRGEITYDDYNHIKNACGTYKKRK